MALVTELWSLLARPTFSEGGGFGGTHFMPTFLVMVSLKADDSPSWIWK